MHVPENAAIVRCCKFASVGLLFLAPACTSFPAHEFANLEDRLPRETLAQAVTDSPACEVQVVATGGRNPVPLSFVKARHLGRQNAQVAQSLEEQKVVAGTTKLWMQISSDGVRPLAKRPDVTPLELYAGDIKSFGEVFAGIVLDPNSYVERTTKGREAAEGYKGAASNLALVFRHYYSHYIAGKYVDRFGTKLDKPDIKKGIGNDVIAAALLVFMDALADSVLATPVLYKGDGSSRIYFPGQNKNQPTAVSTSSEIGRPVVELQPVADDANGCGITEREAKAISLLANLAGEKSAALSKLSLESIGGVNLGFVVVGRFSVGDNETLSTIVTTVMESIARKGSERIAYEFFWGYTDNKTTEEHENEALKDVATFMNTL